VVNFILELFYYTWRVHFSMCNSAHLFVFLPCRSVFVWWTVWSVKKPYLASIMELHLVKVGICAWTREWGWQQVWKSHWHLVIARLVLSRDP
jgi:hypothetical protein